LERQSIHSEWRLALIIKARLGLIEIELVLQLKENSYLLFFIILEAFHCSGSFDLSMVVFFRERLPDSVVNDCNERIGRHGLNAIRSEKSQDGENDSISSSSDQPTQPGSDKPCSIQGTLLIDAMCIPGDIR